MRTNGKYSLIEHQVYTTLTQTYKYNTAVACGILANIYRESSFNPKAENSSSGAYGLIQWLGGRKTNLINYCKNHTYGSHNTVTGQLAFLVHELATTEKKTGTSLATISNTANGAQSAGYTFSKDFERHGNSSEDTRRGELAKTTFWEYYSKYSPTPSDPEVPVTNLGDKIVAFARSEIGTPYSPGGKGPDSYDDVGLVYAAYNSVGKEIPYMTAKALYNRLKNSRKVTQKEASAGDIVFYDAGDYFRAAIANGSGGQILSSNLEGVIEVSSIGDPYAILRVLSDTEVGTSSSTDTVIENPWSSIRYDEAAVINNLSRVSASGYDYGHLIDLVHGGEFLFYIPEFTEQAGANWSNISIVGRSVDVKAYDSTSSRNITISLDLYAGEGLYTGSSLSDVVDKLHSDLNFIKSLEYPDYSDAVIQPPPTVQLILGSAVTLIGVVSGVTVEHMKPLDSQNRAIYAKVSFTVTQTAVNPPDTYDIRNGRYNLASTSDIGSLSIENTTSSNIIDYDNISASSVVLPK